MIDIHQLLIAYKNGDEEAAAVLYGLFRENIIDDARRRGQSRQDAEDLAQETFLKVFKSLSTYNETKGKAAAGWIWTTYRNTLTDKLRKQRGAVEGLEDVNLPPAPPEEFNPLERRVRNEEAECRFEAWRRLSQADRIEIWAGDGRRKLYQEAKMRFDALVEECEQRKV